MPTGYSNLTGENPFKGKQRTTFSKEHRRKIGLASRGRKSWNKGKKGLVKMSEETRKLMSSQRQNEKHPAWKGKKVGYSALHAWITRKIGKAKNFPCGICGLAQAQHWARLSKELTRDLQKWMPMCVKCHYHYDEHVLKTPHGKRL